MTTDRAQSAYAFRVEAAEKAKQREHPAHRANPDEARYAAARYPMSFTKGLEHDDTTGLVARSADFEAFREAIDTGFVEPFTTQVPVPSCDGDGDDKPKRRKWEAPTAGVVFDLQGPDAQAVTMPPAPTLGLKELTYEMAEVYELALLRDVDFSKFANNGGDQNVKKALARLNAYGKPDDFSCRRRKLENGVITGQTLFRGSSPGVENGPYVSQFLLIGNNVPAVPDGNGKMKAGHPEDGYISYGAQVIDQRVLEAKNGDDYMMKWEDWLNVQQGCDPGSALDGQKFTGNQRFIFTPRDLATYVHVDQLYQAYLNACLILLSQKAPFDPSFDKLSGMGRYGNANAGGFALWGGPHILSLVTEVATRALKAVRYQKFNVHLRLRPEALAGRIEKSKEIDKMYPITRGTFTNMRNDLNSTVSAVTAHNKAHPNGGKQTALLPMAFKEGSPMHPSYGAGHAAVAGACVTILKAWFDTSAVLLERNGNVLFGRLEDGDTPVQFEAQPLPQNPNQPQAQLTRVPNPPSPLTLEGELNKLAANISIGRNMAGVHYFSDYYDSVRMGEKIALGILDEQALGYPTDNFVLSVPTFDGETVRIGNR